MGHGLLSALVLALVRLAFRLSVFAVGLALRLTIWTVAYMIIPGVKASVSLLMLAASRAADHGRRAYAKALRGERG